MCEPISIATAIQIGGAAVGFLNTMQQANAAGDAAVRSQEISNAAYSRQQQQINAQATEEMSDRAREAMIERGRLRVLAAESGITGNSTDQIERSSLFGEGFDMSRLEGNRRNLQEQAYADARAGRAASQSRINSVKQPSLIGTGLQIAGAYYDGKASNEAAQRTPTGRNVRGSGPV